MFNIILMYASCPWRRTRSNKYELALHTYLCNDFESVSIKKNNAIFGDDIFERRCHD